MKDICLDCLILEQNTRKVPLWSKREGNDSLLPYIIRDDRYNAKKTSLQTEHPEISKSTVKVMVNSNKNNTWVFYWAATKSTNPSVIMSERDAYGSDTNHGLVKTDDSGNCELILNCPQPYKVNNIVYPRHVHYTFLTSEKTWDENIHSMVVMCDIDYETLREYSNNRSHIIINALDSDDHKKRGIPGSINMYYKDLSELPKRERKKHIKSIMKHELKNYSKLNALINAKKIDYKELPIIVYCEGEKCESSKILSEYLIDCGYVNIAKYSGGLRDWSKKTGDNPDIDTIEHDGNEYIVEDDEIMDPDTYVIVGKLEDGEVKLFETKDKNETEDDLMTSKYKTEIVVNKIGGESSEEKKENVIDSDIESDSEASSSESDIDDLEENETFDTIDSDDDVDVNDNDDVDVDDLDDNDDVDDNDGVDDNDKLESNINELSNNDTKSNDKQKKGGNLPSIIQPTNLDNRFTSLFGKYLFNFY